MLKNIKVKNFQSIDKADIPLGRFTVFTGPSSSGKSALLRASKAAIRNDFVPSQVSQWAKESVFELEFDDCTVGLERGKSKSTYKIDGEVFTKAGRSVPDAVAEKVAMPLISDVEASFATQFDKPFLIADPGAQAAKVLGSLTNVNVLHEGLRESNRRSLESKSVLKMKKADMENVKESLSEYSWLPKSEEIIESLEEDVRHAAEHLHELEEVGRYVEGIERTSQELQEIVVPDFNVDSVSSELEEVAASVDYVSELTSVISTVLRLSTEIDSIDVSGVPEPDFGMIDKLISVVKMLEGDIRSLRTTATKLISCKEDFTEATTGLSSAESEYDTMMSEIEVCPFCGTEMNGEHV